MLQYPNEKTCKDFDDDKNIIITFVDSQQTNYIKLCNIYIFDSDLVWRMKLMIIKG